VTRASIEEEAFLKVMDCRVKPGNDGRWAASIRRDNLPAIRTYF
jgi:hypothetical protein